MTLPKELLDGVDDLVRRFGLANFREAVTAISFSPAACKDNKNCSHKYNRWDPNDTSHQELGISCNDPTMEGKLALLNDGYIDAAYYQRIALTIDQSLTDENTDQIIQAMDSYAPKKVVQILRYLVGSIHWGVVYACHQIIQ
jgi:hypothetical protein